MKGKVSGMRVFQVEYTVKGVSKVEFVKASRGTDAIRELTAKIGKKLVPFFKLVKIDIVKGF